MTEEENNEDIKDGDLIKNDGKDLQRITSWIGRIEAGTKKQNEMFTELSEKIDALSSNKPQKPEFGEDAQEQFNAKLHEMILNGKVMEAIRLVDNVNKEASERLKASDQKKFDAAIGAIAEDPIMKNEDLSKSIRESAENLMKQGYDANAAVAHAKATVENQALREMIQNGSNVSLEMLGGSGKRAPASPEKKLPPEAEAQYQKGKGKIFKDREEYISLLDPRVRENWGL